MPAEKGKRGVRQSEFTQPIADEICRRLVEGDSLRQICADEAMPAQSTVFKWLKDIPLFSEQYACARDLQGDAYADRAVAEALTATDAQIGRLRMDALKWAASKLAPKKYGDRMEFEHKGGVTVVMQDLDDKL